VARVIANLAAVSRGFSAGADLILKEKLKA
jgi:hypothetical protein